MLTLFLKNNEDNGATGISHIRDDSGLFHVPSVVSGDVYVTKNNYKYGRGSLRFDGVNGYVEYPSTLDFGLGSQWTIEFWIYVSTADNSSSNDILRIWNNPSDWNGMLLVEKVFYDSTHYYIRWYWDSNTGSGECTTASGYRLNTDEWNHVRICYDGTNRYIFYNGVDVTESTDKLYSGHSLSGLKYLGIGNNYSSGYFKGNLDHLKIYKNECLSTSNFEINPPIVYFFNDMVDLSSQITTTGWQEIDVSSYVPEDADFVYLYLGGDGYSGFDKMRVRKKGSTDDRTTLKATSLDGIVSSFVGLTADKKFEYYTSITPNDNHALYLVGYSTLESNVYFWEAKDVTPSVSGSWQIVDVSSYIDSSFNGAYLEYVNNGTSNISFDCRMVGDTIDWVSTNSHAMKNYYKNIIIGLDDNQRFEVFDGDISKVKIYFLGTIKENKFIPYKRDEAYTTIIGSSPVGEWDDYKVGDIKYPFIYYKDGYALTSQQWADFRAKGSTWNPPNRYHRGVFEAQYAPQITYIVPNDDGWFQHKGYSLGTRPLYVTGIFLSKKDYVFEGEVSLNLQSEVESYVSYDYSFNGEVSLTLNTEGESSLQNNYEFIGEVNFELILQADYELRIDTILIWDGEVSFNLLLEGDSVPVLDYKFDGEVLLQFNLEPEVYQQFIFDGELPLEIIPFSEYSLDNSFIYEGEVFIRLLPEYDIDIYFYDDRELLFQFILQGETKFSGKPKVFIRKSPVKVSSEFLKLLKIRGESILIYPAYTRLLDPYEQNRERKFVYPISIKALVTDIKSSTLIWNLGGLKEAGAKQLITERRYAKIFRVAYRIEIRGENYTVFKDAENNRSQIREYADLCSVIVSKVGEEFHV